MQRLYVFYFLRISKGATKFVYSLNESIINCGGEEKNMSSMKIEEILKKYTDNLMSISGVVETGPSLCDEEPCIKVFVIKKTSELEKKFPENLKVTKKKLRRQAW